MTPFSDNIPESFEVHRPFTAVICPGKMRVIPDPKNGRPFAEKHQMCSFTVSLISRCWIVLVNEIESNDVHFLRGTNV
jgi:hypothetical protein